MHRPLGKNFGGEALEDDNEAQEEEEEERQSEILLERLCFANHHQNLVVHSREPTQRKSFEE